LIKRNGEFLQKRKDWLDVKV